MVAQQLSAIVGVAEPLHLQTQLVVQTGEQQRELILKRVEMFGCGGAQIRRFDDETFRDVTAFAKAVEDDEVAEEVAVGCRFKHGRWKRRIGARIRREGCRAEAGAFQPELEKVGVVAGRFALAKRERVEQRQTERDQRWHQLR